MAIRNTKLHGADFLEGESVYPNDMNATFDTINDVSGDNFINNGINSIRQMTDRDEKVSKGGIDGFTEAYIDATGRKDSVVVASTDALFYDNKYMPGFTDSSDSDVVYNPDSFVNVANAWDSDRNTAASKSFTSATKLQVNSYEFGKTFDAKTVEIVDIKATFTASSGGSNPGIFRINLQSYDGTSWTDESTLDVSPSTTGSISISYDGVYLLNKNVQGLRLVFSNSGSTKDGEGATSVFMFKYGTFSSGTIYHNITPNILPSTFNTVIGVPFYEENEDGSTIEYKLNNSTTDSGWINVNELKNINTFTEEPTVLQIKLTPSSVSPTAGYPSIRGFHIYGI